MSTPSNDALLEQTSSAIDMAARYAEGLTGTGADKVLDSLVAQVTKHIDDNNLDDLYHFSLPALQRQLVEYSTTMAGQAIDYFGGHGLLSEDTF